LLSTRRMKTVIIRRVAILSVALFALSACSSKKDQAKIKSLESDIETIQEENAATLAEREKELQEKDDFMRNAQSETAQQIQQLTGERDTAVQELAAVKNDMARAEAARLARQPKDASTPGHADFDPTKEAKITSAICTISGDKSSGTGVVVSAEGKVYVYTAAQTLSGNNRLSISNSAGQRFANFGNLEVADGADVVRLELRDAAEAPALQLVDETTKATGNTDITGMVASTTSGTVTGDRGKANGQSSDSIEVDASVIQGKLGGPLLETTTGKVLAIITNPAAERMSPPAATNVAPESLFRACRLNRKMTWKTMPIAAFLADSKRIIDFDNMTRVGQALVGLTATSTGLSGMNASVAGGKSAQTILMESKDIPVAGEVLAMHTQLTGKKSRTSEIDLKKRLSSMISSAMNQMQRGSVGFDPAKFTSYHSRFAEKALKDRKEAEQLLRNSDGASGK